QDTCLDNPPQGNKQLARQSDNPYPAESTTPVAKALLIPRREHTTWLKTQPAPGNLNGHGADLRVPGFGDATLIGGVPPRIGRGGKATESPYFLAITKGPPAEAFHDKDPGTIRPNPLQGQELPHFFHRRILARLEQRTAFGFQPGHALGHRLH